MTNPLLSTPWRIPVMKSLTTLLEHTGATYGAIGAVLTRENKIHMVDVQLLLGDLVKEGYLNATDGIYRLNNTPENIVLFKECREYDE